MYTQSLEYLSISLYIDKTTQKILLNELMIKANDISPNSPSALNAILLYDNAARRSNQSIVKEINPEYSLEGLMLKLKLQYFGHLRGSSPGGSRVIRRWGWSRCLWKNTYLITDIERLEMDSVVGRLVEKKRLNNLDYVE